MESRTTQGFCLENWECGLTIYIVMEETIEHTGDGGRSEINFEYV